MTRATPANPEVGEHLPKACIFRGKRARVISYAGGSRWWIIDSRDMKRLVSSHQVIFTK
jgi:hypothetical protein